MKKGFTLIEVLVSLFIFTLVILAAYKIYDHSQKTYLLGEQLTDTQQSTRFAFEKLAHDLRITGYRVYPDSDALRPDLSVEGMWPGAIAVRADFDRAEELDLECTKNPVTNDCDPATGQYGLVTTGNNDVRVYVLAKKPNNTPAAGSVDELKFKADFSDNRDAIVGDADTLETVTIKGVAITQDKPPYKLYQISFLDPSDTDLGYTDVPDGGAVPAGNMVWTPIADNIFSMNFLYYNQNGIADENLMEADPNDASDPEDRPLFRREHGWPFGGVGGSNTVKNVVVDIIGMTGRPDGRYTDPQINNPALTTEQLAARTATKMHRKYELTSTINMLNVGVAPHELADTIPPDDPTQLEAVAGYCGGVLFTWNGCNAEDLAAYWIQVVDDSLWGSWGGTFKYNCDDAPSTCYATSNPEDYGERVGFYVRNLTNGSAYHARVFAQDNAGNFSRNPTNQYDVIVNPGPLMPSPPTWPDPAAVDPIPVDLRTLSEEVVLGGLNRLQLNFTPSTTYDITQSTTCSNPPGGDPTPLADDGLWPQIRDLYGYRLYHRRQLSATPADVAYIPSDDELVATEDAPVGAPLQIPSNSYTDLKACPCEYYSYKMKAVTDCEDTDDDTGPPCLHVGKFSDISKNPDATPAAVKAPMLQADGVYPQVVPSQPAKPSAIATGLGGDNYDITLKMIPVLQSALKNDATDANYTIPNPDPTAQFEVWRYRIYEYSIDPAVDPDAEATLINDPTTGAPDFDDWDAGMLTDALLPLTALTATSSVDFKFPATIPVGQFRYYAVRGIYRCDDGATTTIFEGPRSEAVQVPCATAWTGVIANPPVDFTLISGGGNIFNIVVAVTGLPVGVTIQSIALEIPTAGVTATLACAGSPACSVSYPWNITGLPDGNYLIRATVTDTAGCQTTLTRIATISQACGPFNMNVLPVSGNQLTWEIQKTNATEYYLLDRIGFTSQTYKYTKVDFFESIPLPASVPINLWQNAAGVDLSGTSIGGGSSGAPNIYNQTNFCQTDATRKNLLVHRHATSPAGTSNWFQATFDKNLTAANGPLNLLGSFTYKRCDRIEVQSVDVPAHDFGSVTLINLPVCSYTWTWTGGSGAQAPAESTVDLCGGFIEFEGQNKNTTVTVTAYSPSSSFVCQYVPILLGP